MSWSFAVARIQGIQLRIHITFVLILIWGAYYWSSVADDGAKGALFGVIATLLLFVCVTLHELGHSVQALQYGIPVEDITLYPIGGVARLRQIPEDPVKEFRIAIAGPLVNVVIVAVLALIAWLAGETTFQWPGDLFDDLRNPTWRSLFPYLIFSNLSLAIFNLLPAFPMDGGRILRSLLAMKMDHARATAIAAAVGQGMALLFGLFGFATGQFFLILIAIFVWMGAGEEGRQTGVRQLLGSTMVGDAMIRQPWSLSPEFPIRRAVELTLTTAQSDFPVVDSAGRVVGLMTLPDLLAALRENPNASVSSVMRREFPTASVNEPISDAQTRLGESGARAMPVVDQNSRLTGLLTSTDIVELLGVLAARSASSNGDHQSRPTAA